MVHATHLEFLDTGEFFVDDELQSLVCKCQSQASVLARHVARDYCPCGLVIWESLASNIITVITD